MIFLRWELRCGGSGSLIHGLQCTLLPVFFYFGIGAFCVKAAPSTQSLVRSFR